jgi:Ca2+-binding EF-hand superfamily protein
MQQTPDLYKIKKYTPVSLTELQVLACLKIYIERDKRKDGWILVTELVEILQHCLGFKCSKKEIEELLIMEYDYKEPVENEKVSFSMFIQIVDILKREKLVLVGLGNNLNYFIFVLLMLLIILYIAFFYTFKQI